MLPKYKKKGGIEIEAPLAMESYPNSIPAVNETLPAKSLAKMKVPEEYTY